MPAAASLTALRNRIRQIEGSARHDVLPFGVAEIDRALPGGGLALGAVHEILGCDGDEEDGAAAAGFAAGILARLGPGPVLWCLKRSDLYGPGLAAHGFDPARLVLVTATRDEEILWAVEEGLREPALAAVVGEVGRWPMVAGRRLQLAAERYGVPTLILRRWRNAAEAATERVRPTAAFSRWRIGAWPSVVTPSLTIPRLRGREEWGAGLGRARWRVELLRVRGGVPVQWNVEVADATGHVSLSAGLADRPAAPARRAIEPLRRTG